MPKLQVAAEKDEDARMMSVLGAGHGGAIDMDDLGLKTSSSIKRKADSATTYNDLMMEELATRHPKLSFAHANPGFVSTNLGSGFPIWLRVPYLSF